MAQSSTGNGAASATERPVGELGSTTEPPVSEVGATAERPVSQLAATTERPVGELVKTLGEQASSLVRQEVELAKAELAVKGREAGIGAGMFGGAGLFGFFAFAALTACFILLLDKVVATWLAALIVAGAYGVIAGVLALLGKGRVQKAGPPVPEQTRDTLKEDVESLKAHARAGRA